MTPALPARKVSDPEAQLNFEQIQKLLPNLMGSAQTQAKIDFGMSAVTWDGTNNLVDVTVDHELGETPVVVLWASSGSHYLNGRVISRTTTQATIEVANNGPAPSAGHSDDIFWLAVA